MSKKRGFIQRDDNKDIVAFGTRSSEGIVRRDVPNCDFMIEYKDGRKKYFWGGRYHNYPKDPNWEPRKGKNKGRKHK